MKLSSIWGIRICESCGDVHTGLDVWGSPLAATAADTVDVFVCVGLGGMQRVAELRGTKNLRSFAARKLRRPRAADLLDESCSDF